MDRFSVSVSMSGDEEEETKETKLSVKKVNNDEEIDFHVEVKGPLRRQENILFQPFHMY